MICKYCGAKIDPESEVCPKCGKRGNKREGGNGFWDIAKGPAPAPKPEPVVVHEQKTIKSYIPIAICGLICLLSLLIAIIGIASGNSRINAFKNDFESQMAEQTRQMAEENHNLQRQIDQLSNRLAEYASQPAYVEESLRILSSPTPETCDVGFQSRDGFYLFGLRVEGQVAAFRWEKQQQNGDWVTIAFDENSINRELGLRLEENISEGTSRLIAIGLTPVSFGTYKCTAVGVNGSVQSATVDLINSSTVGVNAPGSPSYAETPAPTMPFPTGDGNTDDYGEPSSEDTDSDSGEKKGGWW